MRLIAWAIAALVGLSAAALGAEYYSYSCRHYDDEQRKCAFGSCNELALEQFERQCLYDGIALGADPYRRPYSCRLYDDEQKKCAFGSCDKRTLERLQDACLRDGGRP